MNNLSNNKQKPRILFVMHSGPGGTEKTVHELIKNINFKFDCFLLVSDSNYMNLLKYNNSKFEKIETWELYTKWLIETPYIEEYSNIYFNLLIKYNFDLVHIHHLIFHTFDLPDLCYKLGIPMVLSIHDLYFICPAYTLLDGDYKNCDGKCINSTSEKNCFIPMPHITHIENMKNYVEKWRKHVSKIFSYFDFFIVPSDFIKNIMFEHYNLSKNNIYKIEHGLDYNQPNEKLFDIPSKDKPTKILFLGNLYLQKGYKVIKELFKLDKNNALEFHFLGYTPDELKNIGIHHGTYKSEDLYNHIKIIKPSFIGIFSICGESYCYTLSEAWAFNIPVLVSNLGALKERLLENGGGWFIDIDDINNTYEIILSKIQNTEEYLEKQKETENIKFKSNLEMSNEYISIYKKIIPIS